jgi:hypothetical protein
MKTLTVFTNPDFFRQIIPWQLTRGFEEAGYNSEVVDLFAVRGHESPPPEILDEMSLKRQILDTAGGLTRRFAALPRLRDRDPPLELEDKEFCQPGGSG